MNKQEALEELDKSGRQFFQAATDLKLESNSRNVASGVFSGISIARSVLAQLDEPQKVKVPAIVAKWIKWNKNKGGSVFILFDIDKVMAFEAHQNDKGLIDWMIDHRNHDFLIRAWLDGYEVEEEPKYKVIMPNPQSKNGNVLVLRRTQQGTITVNKVKETTARLGEGMDLTEKEIKSVDERYWPFAVSVEKV